MLVLWLLPAAPPASAAGGCARGHVALTFDDGPGPHTPAVLDALAARDVPATFFVVGQRVLAAPAVIRRQADEGHVVANHTYAHERLTALSDASIRSTVAATARAISAAGARPAPVVRPPYGATNARVQQVLRAAGYAHILWTADTRDWQGPSADVIAQRAIAGLAPGAVILFHDGSPRAPNTIAALPRIIDTARAAGYCFGVLDDAGRVVAPAPPEPPAVPARHVAPPQQVSEIAGPTRYETAVAVSRTGWPQGASQVVLVTGQRYPDALTASALAGTVEGPLLLVAESRLDPAIADELRRLGAEHAYLIGPLSDAVEAAVRDLGIATTRLRGPDRYETSTLIATEVAHLEAETATVLVATGADFADALAASTLAAGLRHPILLTRPSGDQERLASVVEALGAQHTLVVGGPAAVPEDAVAGLPGLERVAGPVRAATAALVADRALALGYARDPLLASGQTFPDALVGGVLSARLGRPMLLTAGSRLSPEVHQWLDRNGAGAVIVLGGEAAVGPGPRSQLRTGLDRPT